MKISEWENLVEELYEQDQADRLSYAWEDLDWDVIRANDRARLEKVNELSASGDLLNTLSGKTLYKLAMLFHHSEFNENVERAGEIANLSGERGYKKGFWLQAAAEDRLLQRAGKPQKWGTQFQKNHTGEWERYPLMDDAESGITDVERIAHDVPPRDTQLEVFLQSESAT